MSEIHGCVDPSKVHLKRKLTQIRRVSRVLRDPGTTSYLKSPPLLSSRSVVSCSSSSSSTKFKNRRTERPTMSYNGTNGDKVKRVFLHNWKNNYKSYSEKSTHFRNQGCNDHSLGIAGNLISDSMSDSYNVGSKNTKHEYHIVVNDRKSTHSSVANSIDLNYQSEDDASGLRQISTSKHKILSNIRKDDSSYAYNSTPTFSTSSYHNYQYDCGGNQNNTSVYSHSFNEDDWMGENFDIPDQNGCGIPCYWSKRSTPKLRVYSPLSDSSMRKGSSMLCGSQTMKNRSCRMRRSKNLKINSKNIPLLTNSCTVSDDGEFCTNFEELNLEALSRLDETRWSSSCKETLELQALTPEERVEEAKSITTTENIRCFSYKYKPLFFNELVGQNIVVQSLTNSVCMGRIAPVYLFQGPRGTGKTSAARIFSAALNCVTAEQEKKGNPCGLCTECINFISGKDRDFKEIDGTNKESIDRVKEILKDLLVSGDKTSRFKVFVINECRLLPSKIWLQFLKFIEQPLPRVVFIFITVDFDSMPRTVISRCQKYIFNKIKDCDIVTRLRKISHEENVEVESSALDLIALNVDGSLRDAETMLDQLSLLGKRITSSLVNEHVGVVSDEKLLDLLEIAMSSDTAETVKIARELLDSGLDPMALMSQMASLIMDLISGTRLCILNSKNYRGSFFGGPSLTDKELKRLKHALKLLSDAEKQLRVSSERSTWFTATLLQLGLASSSSDFTCSVSSKRQSFKTTEENPSNVFKELLGKQNRNNIDGQCVSQKSTSFVSDKLDDMWAQCIARCHSKTLRQLLHDHGKLLSILEVEGILIAYIAFNDDEIKSRADRFLSSITDSIETVLRCNVEIRLVILQDNEVPLKPIQDPIKLSKGSLNSSQSNFKVEMQDRSACSPSLIHRSFQSTVESTVLPMQRIESIIHEQNLETAWLQITEKGTPKSFNRSKPEKNQVLPQDGMYRASPIESASSMDLSLNPEMKVLNIINEKALQKEQNSRRAEHYPMSPNVLHGSGLVGKFEKDKKIGYESESGGCSGLFCWNNTNHRKREKAKQVTSTRPHQRTGQFLWFGE